MIKSKQIHIIDKNRPKGEPQYPGMYDRMKRKDMPEEQFVYLSSAIIVIEKKLGRKLSEAELGQHVSWSYEYFGFYKWLAGEKVEGLNKLILPQELLSLMYLVLRT